MLNLQQGTKILFGLTHIPMCVSTAYSVLPSSVKNNLLAYYFGGIQTNDLCQSRADSCQLDQRDCLVARGSSNYPTLNLHQG